MSEPRERDLALPTHSARVLEWGSPDAPLVLALHGFPDTAWSFRHLGPYLAEQGWRVAAPFTRGYAPSGVPSDGVLTIGSRMADAVALHERLGGDERAVLVGHDWGALTATGLAAHPGSPYGRVVAMAVPPLTSLNPGPWRPWLGAVARQPLKSWYIALNQVPGLSERHLDRLVPLLWRRWCAPGYDARADVAHVLDSLAEPTHARAAVAYYRQVLRTGRAAARYADFERCVYREPVAPLLVLLGALDGCLDPGFFDVVSARLPASASAVQVGGVGHFLHLEDPATLNPLIGDFLAG